MNLIFITTFLSLLCTGVNSKDLPTHFLNFGHSQEGFNNKGHLDIELYPVPDDKSKSKKIIIDRSKGPCVAYEDLKVWEYDPTGCLVPAFNKKNSFFRIFFKGKAYWVKMEAVYRALSLEEFFSIVGENVVFDQKYYKTNIFREIGKKMIADKNLKPLIDDDKEIKTPVVKIIKRNDFIWLKVDLKKNVKKKNSDLKNVPQYGYLKAFDEKGKVKGWFYYKWDARIFFNQNE